MLPVVYKKEIGSGFSRRILGALIHKRNHKEQCNAMVNFSIKSLQNHIIIYDLHQLPSTMKSLFDYTFSE